LTDPIYRLMATVAKKPRRSTKRSQPAASGWGAAFVPITTFAPEPYQAHPGLVAVLQAREEGFIASLYDANIHASGDTEEEAFRNLKSLILDVFESLSTEAPKHLGPEPRRQLAVLQQYIHEKH